MLIQVRTKLLVEKAQYDSALIIHGINFIVFVKQAEAVLT